MTINVKVDVYAGANWDAEVIALDHAYPRLPRALPRSHTILSVVTPGGSYTACGTETRDILVREVKHPEKTA